VETESGNKCQECYLFHNNIQNNCGERTALTQDYIELSIPN